MFLKRLVSLVVVGSLWCSPAMTVSLWDMGFKEDHPAGVRAAQRFALFQQVENLRFRMNGCADWKYPPHGHSDAVLDEAPQTALSACVHYLFPSPDGVGCTPNTAVSDPVSQLKGEALGTLYKMCGNVPDDKESKKREVYQFLLDMLHPKTTPDYDTLKPRFRKLSKFEVRQSFAHTVELYDNMLEKEGHLPYTAIAQRFFPEAFPKILKSGQVEDHLALLKRRIRKSGRHSPASVGPEPSPKLLAMAEEYDRHAGAYSCMRLASACVDAAAEDPSWLQDVLMVYAWKKAGNEPTEETQRKSIRDFHGEAFGEKLSDDFFTNTYTDKDYVALKSELQASPETWNTLSVSQLAWLYKGKQTFGRALPAPLLTGRALYDGRVFSDCAETALRYVICALSYKETGEGSGVYGVDPAVYPEGSKARTFLSKFGSRALLGEARNEWAELVSNLPGVRYVKAIGRRVPRGYEVVSCGVNALRVLMSLALPPEGLADPLLPLTNAAQDIRTTWEAFMKLFNFNYFEEVVFSDEWTSGDCALGTTTLKLSVGEVEIGQEPGHTTVKCRENMTEEKLAVKSLEGLSFRSSLMPLLSLELLQDVLSLLSPEEQGRALFSLDLSSSPVRLKAVSSIFKLQMKDWYRLATSLVEAAGHDSGQLDMIAAIASMHQEEIISDEVMLNIVQNVPSLLKMNSILHPHPVLWWIVRTHQEEKAPHIFSLGELLIPPFMYLESEEKERFFDLLKRRFTALKAVSISSLGYILRDYPDADVDLLKRDFSRLVEVVEGMPTVKEVDISAHLNDPSTEAEVDILTFEQGLIERFKKTVASRAQQAP